MWSHAQVPAVRTCLSWFEGSPSNLPHVEYPLPEMLDPKNISDFGIHAYRLIC